MTDCVLRVESVSKSYPSYGTELARYARWFGLPGKPSSVFHAVQDVSFEVGRGEALALVGQNGAGKSTILKLITGTVQPTSGKIERFGRISAILELGLGFNPEFTGRENVLYSGGLMGFTARQLDELIPEIEAFAEIGEHFDKPLRTYSSGMQARLAFALATAARPEILIVDEVLSVGDSYFSHKSFARIREFREQGTTILMVTHSMADVIELCDRALLLDRGQILREGQPDEIVDFYNAIVAEKENALASIEQRREKNGWSVTRSGDFRAIVSDIELVSAETGDPIAAARTGERLALKVHVDVRDDLPVMVLGLMIRDRTGHQVWGTNTWHTNQRLKDLKAGERIAFTLHFDCRLGPASYSVSPALVSSSTHLDDNYEWTDNFFVFDVVNPDQVFFIGTTHLDATFEIERDANA